jgi:hypothetical protein
MRGMSEDEGDAEDEPEVKVDEEKHEAARQAREARQEKLRKMMDDAGRMYHLQAQPISNLVQTKKCPMHLRKSILSLGRHQQPMQTHQNQLKAKSSQLKMVEDVVGDE